MEDKSVAARMAIRNPRIIQLYSAQTPNGIKIAACLEEIKALKSLSGGFDYEPHTVDIRKAESRSQFFNEICVNGKIPALVDPNGPEGREVKLFESGAILLYLAEHYNELYPCGPGSDPVQRLEVQKWLMWGSASLSTQMKTFGFYYQYAPHKMPYCVLRFAKSCHRLLGVLESQLSSHDGIYIVAPGHMYTIADISIWPWIYGILNNYSDAGQVVFKNLEEYPRVRSWYQRCMARPANIKSLEVTPFFD